MSVKSFKFVSPGVFINEIDNSFRPRRPDAIGPVVVGRATRGPAMQPIKVESYSEFVQVFGDTVPGNGGGDIYRDGNFQSPMYGTYAAKAFLNANVAPLTYVRLLGEQNLNKTAAGENGWATTKTPASALADNGGAYGLWMFNSGTTAEIGTGSLAAIWYLDTDAAVLLTGSFALTKSGVGTASVGGVITQEAGEFTVLITSSLGEEKITFNFDDSSDKFIRKVFNTNPQLGNSTATSFYPAASQKAYWLGETFEQEVRDGITSSITGSTSGVPANSFGVILPLKNDSAAPSDMTGITDLKGRTGWFIGQDLGLPASYTPEGAQKLFYLKDRGHSEWLNKNVKVSIEEIKPSSTRTSDYGTFSIVLRSLADTDNRVVVLERFDNLTLNPSSPDFIAKRIGDSYYEWVEAERRLREYGDYGNLSKYVYVVMNSDVEAGATDATLLPFGYYGAPRYGGVKGLTYSGPEAAEDLSNVMVLTSSVYGVEGFLTGGVQFTGSFTWPAVRLRHSASDGGIADRRSAYFGMQTTRKATSTTSDMSVADPHRQWPGITGDADYSYIFTMDDVYLSGSNVYYLSGSRVLGISRTAVASASALLDVGHNRFTAPMWGGFDGFDITKPDPMYNIGLASGTDLTNYAVNTMKRAIDTVADPEFIDMNLLASPGLTNTGLTTRMVELCEERADALALIDLPNVYIPAAEVLKSSKQARVVGDAQASANALRTRQIDSSYGATFFPWVQTTDAPTGQLLWIPPSVAMMGVLASSEKQSQVWFAPAGFNRGGLSDGAAGIPVSNVTQRLTSKERDTLYEARINPIASFPSSGIVVFGQKTLQERSSALDRINVRRLVIYLKKQISIISTQILFEQNVQATWNRFKGLVEPFLANVKVQFGVSDYRLILDESTTTPDLIDQNIMYAKIMVKPARAIEYIAIDFVVASTGASFDD